MKQIIIKNINIPISSDMQFLRKKIAKLLSVKSTDFDFKILKKSIDARKKNDLKYIYSIAVDIKKGIKYNKNAVVEEEVFDYSIIKANKSCNVAIIGAGPAGLFAALALCESGIKPIIFERGSKIEEREKIVNSFFNTGNLNVECNIQFGEGGAGAFSDGKLNTGIKNLRSGYVLRKFVECGAPECILYDAHPHIGTDNLKVVVKNIREKIISLGGKFEFNARVTDFICSNGKVEYLTYEKNGKIFEHKCDSVILAVGHSARDVFDLLQNKTILEKKPFSIGLRIEHLREDVNRMQFGREIGVSAEYKLSHKCSNGRGVYTFCMCPGGVVVPSSSEEFGVVTNGMSDFKRDAINSNSAILVSINPDDFGSDDVLSGVYFQRKFERLAYEYGGKNYSAPYQTMGDFFSKRISTGYGKVKPSYALGVKGVDFNKILPDFVSQSLVEGLKFFNGSLKGFSSDDSVLTGIETRSSSPIRILRDENCEAIKMKGLYPTGEGAGYSGGITSSAVDGVFVAEKIIEKMNV